MSVFQKWFISKEKGLTERQVTGLTAHSTQTETHTNLVGN